MRKYESIKRHGKQGTNAMFESGEKLIIEEKLDGANASMMLEDGKVRCFSRNQELDEHNTLRGFYQYAQEFADRLEEGFIYYGEWLAPHKIKYDEEAYKKFYLFDVFDIASDKYLPIRKITRIGRMADMSFVPHFSLGIFSSVEEVMEYVGKSKLGEKGEGIVIKYWNSDKRDILKIVTPEFQEAMGVKPTKPKKDMLQKFVEANVTEARIEKLILKLVDAGTLPEEFDITDTGAILKALGSSVYEDVMAEERDVLEKLVRKQISKHVPKIVKQVIVKH